MERIVGVTKGDNKFNSFEELLRITNFDDTLSQELDGSKKLYGVFKIFPFYRRLYKRKKQSFWH